MVSAAEKIVIRYVSANLASKLESTLGDLSKARLFLDFDILHGLMEQLSRGTRISNPEISEKARELARVFQNAHEYMKSEVLDALGDTRALVESAVF